MRRFQAAPGVAPRRRAIVLGASASDKYMLLGRLSEVGPEKSVYLDFGQEHVTAVVGKRGSGKTHTLGVLIEGLAVSDPTGVLGVKNADRAVLVVDTLNLFQWMGIPLASAGGPAAAAQRLAAQRWKLPAASLQPLLWHLAGSDPVTQDSMPFSVRVGDMTPQDWGLLMDVDTVGEPMGQLISAVHTKVTRSGWKAGKGRRSAVANPAVCDLTECITQDTEILTEFTPETRRAVRQRLTSYERTGLFSTEGTPLENLIRPGRVSILLMGLVKEDLRTLVAFLLIRRLLEQRAAASAAAKDTIIRGTSPKGPAIPKTWILVDEAQNIIPSNTASLANRELTRFVREGRNYGLSMVISTQQPAAIDTRVMAQVDVVIAHTLTAAQDVGFILSNLKAAKPDWVSIGRNSVGMPETFRELEVGQCLVSAVESPRTLFVEIRPRVTPHGGFEA